MPPEGNVFESVGTRGYILRIDKLRVLAYATMAVGHRLVFLKTAVNDAFAIQTCDVCDSGKHRAVSLSIGKWGVSGIAQPPLVFAARENRQQECSQITETKAQNVRSGLDMHVQLSRLRSVLTPSHPRKLPPYAASRHPGPFSEQEPLPMSGKIPKLIIWIVDHRLVGSTSVPPHLPPQIKTARMPMGFVWTLEEQGRADRQMHVPVDAF